MKTSQLVDIICKVRPGRKTKAAKQATLLVQTTGQNLRRGRSGSKPRDKEGPHRWNPCACHNEPVVIPITTFSCASFYLEHHRRSPQVTIVAPSPVTPGHRFP